jgi:hypothetical protein
VVYDLSIGFFPERLANILIDERLPADWVAAIFDSKGIIAARTHAAARFVGQRGAPALMERMAQVSDGMVSTKTLEGIDVSSLFSRSQVSGWALAIGVPTATLKGQQWRYLGWSVTCTLILAACGLVAAHFTAARLTRAVRILGVMAPAFGRGELVKPQPLGLKEVDAVVQSLADGARLLEARAAADADYLDAAPAQAIDQRGLQRRAR